jgi:hypothetical protein
MCLANSHTTIVLFDSRSSPSFISSKFVAKHNLPITIMKYTVIVISLGGEMKTKHICLAISITIMGVDFLLNLIIIDSLGIDIILGTGWLRKYDRVILCTKRAIRLTQEDGTTVDFVVAIVANQINVLNQVKGTYLDEIRIVQKFLNVFQKSCKVCHPIEILSSSLSCYLEPRQFQRGHIGCL